jgi:hypothetical protein
LQKNKIGRSNFYVNKALFSILTKNNMENSPAQKSSGVTDEK